MKSRDTGRFQFAGELAISVESSGASSGVATRNEQIEDSQFWLHPS
jgi:hypothetical protein